MPNMLPIICLQLSPPIRAFRTPTKNTGKEKEEIKQVFVFIPPEFFLTRILGNTLAQSLLR